MDYPDHIGLWQKELASWVPDLLFDAHVHLGPDNILKTALSPERTKLALSTFTHFTYNAYLECFQKLFSGRKLAGMFAFPFPLREIRYAPANQYIIKLMQTNPAVKGFVWFDPKRPEALPQQLQKAEKNGVRFIGVKPYFDTLGKNNFDATMPELLPLKSLRLINDNRLLLMLHTTGRGIGEEKTRDFIRMISDRFANIQIILAHAGRFVNPQEFDGFMNSDLPERENLFLDISSVAVEQVLLSLLRMEKLRARILFASDLPFGLITGVEHWSETGGALFRTRDQYSWSEAGLCGHRNLTWNVYHVVRALKNAMAKLDIDDSDKELLKLALFAGNAQKLFEATQ